MIKGIITFTLLLSVSLCFGQALPINFDSGTTTSDFIDFDGGTATVIDNPQSDATNSSAKVAQIVRNGGEVWAGSKISLSNPLDFSTDNIISMKVFVTTPVGTIVKFKLEGGGEAAERDAMTTTTNAWETLTWDFTGTSAIFTDIVFMFDFGNTGDGSANSTFLFDDVEQVFGGSQIDFPVTFEDSGVNYTTTDFGGNVSTLVADPMDASNTVAQAIKTDQAATWAGTTIGTPAGFATNVPLTLTNSTMTVKVWSPDANTPIRLKVEDSNDPTHTCETEVNTTVAGDWEVLTFDFATEAPGTAALSFGLDNGWTYNMASIFFNFGTEGQAAGEKTYYFDNVAFGIFNATTAPNEVEGLRAFPNPTNHGWTINAEQNTIQKVVLFDLQGKRLLVLEPNASQATIPATNFVAGVYMATVYTDLGVRSFRLVRL